MLVSANSRVDRRVTQTDNRNSRRTYACLLSCCLFFAILCACLLTALVLIGKHLYNDRNSTVTVTTNVDNIKFLQKFSLTRLPTDAKPVHYNITVAPDLLNGRYKGFVNITIKLDAPRHDLILHSNKLTIDAVDLLLAGGHKSLVQNVKEDAVNQLLYIVSKKILLPNTYYLNLNFSGNLMNKTVGLYLSRYENSDSHIKRYVVNKSIFL